MRWTIIGIELCGVLLAIVLLSSGIGAVAAPATEKNSPKEAAYEHYIRLKVLEVAEAERIEKGRLLQLKVQRWYGKIDAKSLRRNQEYETQEFRILFPAAAKADVKIGDIIDYRVVGYLSNSSSLAPLSPAVPDPLPKTAEEDSLRFSETHELVLSMNSMKFMLDLDTGKTMDPPATRRPDEAQMDVQTDQIQSYHYPKELIGRGLQGMEVRASEWDASAAEVRRALTGDRVGPLKQMDVFPEINPTNFFKTRDGALGVLQLLEIVHEPKGIRLRYKRVESEPAIITALGGERVRAEEEG